MKKVLTANTKSKSVLPTGIGQTMLINFRMSIVTSEQTMKPRLQKLCGLTRLLEKCVRYTPFDV